MCIADFLSRFAQTGRPGGPINARRDGRVSAFLGEDPRTSTTIIISLPTTLRSYSRRLHQVWLFFFTSPRPKKRLTRGITVSQCLQKRAALILEMARWRESMLILPPAIRCKHKRFLIKPERMTVANVQKY